MKAGSDLFIVDNSDSEWKVRSYLSEWCDISSAIDIATGYFEIGALLCLKEKWQGVERIRVLMGDEVSRRTRHAFEEGLRKIVDALDSSIEEEKKKNDFLDGVPAVVEAIRARKIVCRVYRRDKFHAKAYITHGRTAVVGSFALVGSSNLTYPGLNENVELNVQVRGPEVGLLQEWYEKHWQDAEDVTTDIRFRFRFLTPDQAVWPWVKFKSVVFSGTTAGKLPVIYFRYHLPDKWPKVRNLDDYLLRSLMAGAFSGSPDNLIDQCVKTIKDDGDFIVPRLFDTIRAEGRSLEVSADLLQSLMYGSKELHLFFNLWYKDFNYQPAFQNNEPQVDHIFPQSFLRSVKDVSPETGRKSIVRYKTEQRDQVANCMLLTARENGSGGKTDIPPEEWFTKQVAEFGESYLEMHLIPKEKELWKLENFERFVEARKGLILKKFAPMIIGSSGTAHFILPLKQINATGSSQP